MFEVDLFGMWRYFVHHVLYSQSWQGIAGIAQIVAAILSIITIKQARDMQIQADLQKRESVAPDWGVVEVESNKLNNEFYQYKVVLMNTGLGPAKNVTAVFRTDNGRIDVDYNSVSKICLTENCIQISTLTKEFEESIVIKCLTRYGDPLEWKISNFQEGNSHKDFIEITLIKSIIG